MATGARQVQLAVDVAFAQEMEGLMRVSTSGRPGLTPRIPMTSAGLRELVGGGAIKEHASCLVPARDHQQIPAAWKRRDAEATGAAERRAVLIEA